MSALQRIHEIRSLRQRDLPAVDQNLLYSCYSVQRAADAVTHA